MADHHVEPLLRRPRVQDVSGRSRSTLYKNIKEGLWTRPVSLGPRAVAWPAHEVAALNAARIAGKVRRRNPRPGDQAARGPDACAATGDSR